ncbi:MAG TPA: hypothetical protein VHK27_05445 [Gammaproteobacteria bacterium]|nr:hypothetical protein [Gammaproteobacteria bacterium]
MAEMKVTHDVLMDGGMCEDPQAGDCVRFFSKSRLKQRDEFTGPLVFHPKSVDARFLNLLLNSPILYQATQRAKLDAVDLQEKLKALAVAKDIEEFKGLTLDMMAQLIALQHVMDMTQNAVIEGV